MEVEVKVHEQKFVKFVNFVNFYFVGTNFSSRIYSFDLIRSTEKVLQNSNFSAAEVFGVWPIGAISSILIHNKFETENWDFNFHFPILPSEEKFERKVWVKFSHNYFSRTTYFFSWASTGYFKILKVKKFIFCANFSDELLRPFCE